MLLSICRDHLTFSERKIQTCQEKKWRKEKKAGCVKLFLNMPKTFSPSYDTVRRASSIVSRRKSEFPNVAFRVST